MEVIKIPASLLTAGKRRNHTAVWAWHYHKSCPQYYGIHGYPEWIKKKNVIQ
jgi:hypothetical protein